MHNLLIVAVRLLLDAIGDASHYESSDPLDSGYTSLTFDSHDVSPNLQWKEGKEGEDCMHVVLSKELGLLFVGIYDGFSGFNAQDFLISNLYK